MYFYDGGFQFHYQSVSDVTFGVNFVAINGFSSFFGPSTIFAASCFCLGSTRLIGFLVAGICCYECSILNNTFTLKHSFPFVFAVLSKFLVLYRFLQSFSEAQTVEQSGTTYSNPKNFLREIQ